MGTTESTGLRGDWPFRMREDIFMQLREPLVGHGATVVVLRGAAGAGKSRIGRECAAWHRHRGRRVTWIGANGSLQTIPWGAFAELDGSARKPVAVLRELSERIGRGPREPLLPLLICDDAHHLDERSAAVVGEVVRRAKASVVITVRDGTRVPEAIRLLIENDATSVIDVPELDQDGVAEVLAEVTGRRVRPSAVDTIYSITRGNFLYLRELLRGEIVTSRVAPPGEEWTWRRDAALPHGLTNVVKSLLDSLDIGTRELVDLLAVAPLLRCEVYERIVGAEVIERAESEGLVRSSLTREGVELEAAHPLFVEVARQEMGVHRRMRLSGRLATVWAEVDAIAGRTPSTQDILRDARLRLDSELETPPDHFAAAASLAFAFTDLELAERLSRAALKTAEHPEALFVLGMALAGQAQGAEASSVLERYAQIVPTGDQHVAAIRAGTMFWPLREPDGAIAFVEQALHRTADSTAAAGLNALRALFQVLVGNIASDSQIVPTTDAPGDDFGAVVHAWARTTAFALQGRGDDAVDAAMSGYEGHAPTNFRFGVAEMHLTSLRMDGRTRGAIEVTRRFSAEAVWSGGLGATLERRLRGRAALIESRLQDAVDVFEDLRAELVPLAPNGLLFSSHLDLAQAHALRGDAVPARRAIDAALADMHPGFAYLFPEMDIALSLVLAAEGRIHAAVATVRAAVARARTTGADGFESLALAVAAQLGDGAGASRLRELSTRVQGPRVRIALQHAEALQGADSSSLCEVSVAYEAMGDLVAAADATAQAAIRLHADARTRDALRASQRASSLAARAQGARTFALRRLEQPPSLSAREYEIACLAAGGLSNRSIAELLGISVRTVEGHVLRAIAKSGVSNRAALATSVARNT